jgi:hypothetical protein
MSPVPVFFGHVFGVVAGLPDLLKGTVITLLPPFLVAPHVDVECGPFSSMRESGNARGRTVELAA